MKEMKTLTIGGQTYKIADGNAVHFDGPQDLTPKQQSQARKNIGITDAPDVSAEYFTITEDGVLSLKPEYRGEPTKNTYADAISDMGVGVAGSKNAELPEHLVIPETVDIGGIVGDVAVDRIADGAFYGNKAIKIVTFPKTVNEIPNGCFQNSFVENVYNTEHVTTVGTAAFKYSNIKSVNLPNLTSMGEGAFMSCSYLTHANIGNVTEILADCFYKDYALSRVESNHKVVSVDHTAFQNTPRLANADFVQNLTSIGAGAFIKSGLEYDWDKLKNCTFENNATALQINPTDFWSDCSVTPCENSVKPVFSQKDPRWADRQIGKSSKTYSQGCILFSIMNIFCGINNLDISTVEEFEEIVEGIKPGHLDTYTLSMRDVPTFVEPLGLEASLIDGFNPYSLQKLYDALADGKYAIVHTSNGAIDGSMSGHAIAAYGLTPTGKIMFADSSSRYYNEPMAGGSKYALPYKVTTANQSADNPEFCIISKPIEYSRYATIEDALAETNEVADGVVGAYTDRFGKYHIALLGDMESATTINIQRDCTFHLNGYTLTFTAADAYLNISNAKDVIIDGTVVRKDAHTSNMRKGTIRKDGVTNTSGGENLVKTTGTNLTVYGGVYSLTNITTPDKKSARAISAGVSDPVATISLNDCSIVASGSSGARAYGVQADSAVVNNCVIETETVDGYSSAVYVYVDAVINNSTLTSEATSNGPAQCVSSSSSCTKFDIANTTIRATVNGYSANNDNHAIGVQAVDGMIATITDCDIVVNRVGVDESDYMDTPVTKPIHKHQGGGTVILNGTNNLVPAYP